MSMGIRPFAFLRLPRVFVLMRPLSKAYSPVALAFCAVARVDLVPEGLSSDTINQAIRGRLRPVNEAEEHALNLGPVGMTKVHFLTGGSQ